MQKDAEGASAYRTKLPRCAAGSKRLSAAQPAAGQPATPNASRSVLRHEMIRSIMLDESPYLPHGLC